MWCTLGCVGSLMLTPLGGSVVRTHPAPGRQTKKDPSAHPLTAAVVAVASKAPTSRRQTVIAARGWRGLLRGQRAHPQPGKGWARQGSTVAVPRS